MVSPDYFQSLLHFRSTPHTELSLLHKWENHFKVLTVNLYHFSLQLKWFANKLSIIPSEY